VLLVAVLISYPWPVLTVGTLCFLASLPLGWMSYRNYERAAAPATAASRQSAETTPAVEETDGSPSIRPPDEPPDEKRPPRLN
jgi:CDP-diacylglycerol--serine O-phosphatidyltransferase